MNDAIKIQTALAALLNYANGRSIFIPAYGAMMVRVTVEALMDLYRSNPDAFNYEVIYSGQNFIHIKFV